MADRSLSTPARPPRSRSLPWRKSKARRPGSVTALDVDGQVLRLAQMTPRGEGMLVMRTEVVPLDLAPDRDRSDAAALGTAIAKALHKLHLKPAQVVMGVPRQMVVLRNLSLPMIEDVRELASMVHMQIAKDLPFKQEEAIIDFVVRAQSNPNEPTVEVGKKSAAPQAKAPGNIGPKAEVLVAAVKRETVEFYENAAAAAKLKLAGLGWLSQANARCVAACGVAVDDECVAFVTLRPDEVGIDVMAGSLLFSRGAAIHGVTRDTEPERTDGPPVDPTPAVEAVTANGEDYVNAVTIELVRSLHSYNGVESNPPIAKLVVAGVTGYEDTVTEALRKRLKLPCSRLDPVESLELSNAAHEHASGTVGAIGLGFSVNDPGGLPFDFLNPKRPAVQRNTRRIRMLAWGAAAAVMLIALLAVRSHLMGERLRISEQVQKELTGAEKQLPTYRRMQQYAAAVQGWVKGERNWLEHFAYLSAVLPGSEDLYITSLSVSGQGAIHMAVQARSGEILADLDRQLRAAGYEVKPLAITPGNDRHGYSFRSTVELIAPVSMKIDLSKIHPPARPEDDGSLDGKKPGAKRGGRS